MQDIVHDQIPYFCQSQSEFVSITEDFAMVRPIRTAVENFLHDAMIWQRRDKKEGAWAGTSGHTDKHG